MKWKSPYFAATAQSSYILLLFILLGNSPFLFSNPFTYSLPIPFAEVTSHKQ